MLRIQAFVSEVPPGQIPLPVMSKSSKKKKAKRVPDHQWVYIMSNASMPGLLKIGMTTTSPQQRNRELGSATGVPTPFVLEYSLEVANARRVEQVIHKELSAYRVNRRREFFEMEVSHAIRALKSVARQRQMPLAPTLLLHRGLEILTAVIVLWVLIGFWGGSGP